MQRARLSEELEGTVMSNVVVRRVTSMWGGNITFGNEPITETVSADVLGVISFLVARSLRANRVQKRSRDDE